MRKLRKQQSSWIKRKSSWNLRYWHAELAHYHFKRCFYLTFWGFGTIELGVLPCGGYDKESSGQCRRPTRCRLDPLVGKIPSRRKWQPTPVFLPGESHGQRSPVGYSPWGHKESDMYEHVQRHTDSHRLTHKHTHPPTIMKHATMLVSVPCCLVIF